jgi:ABC-2 type transport system permease protein
VTLQPGSTLWLMRHELRLTWRGFTRGRAGGGGRFRRLWLLLVLPTILLFTAGLPLGFGLRHVQIPIVPVAVVVVAAGALGLFTLMLAQTLAAAVAALYERADLDLLFSSPLEPRRVLTVRFLAVAVNVYALFGLITTPIVLPSVVMGHPGWIGLEAVLLAIALAATGAGLLMAAALFRAIGARRTRTVGQVLAAITGAAFFITAQAYNILGRRQSASIWQTIAGFAADPRFRPPPGLDWPLRAALGEPLPLLAIVAAGVGLFAIANQVLGASFAADAAAAAGAGAGAARRARAGPLSPFRAGVFQATVRKELRLLSRDPALISQVLLRVLYLIPLGAVLLRNAGRGQTLLLPGSVAALGLMAGQVAASLAWITISAEDSPDLLAVSPAAVSVLRRGKIAAAIGPVALLVAPVLVALAAFSPWIALVGAAGAAAQMAMGAYMNVWWQRPGKRAEFRRRRQASWFVSLAELLLGLLIAGATALIAFGTAWGLAPTLLAGAAILLLRRSDEQIAAALRAA